MLHHHRSGFTLVEVAIATMVLVTASLVVLMLLPSAMQAQQDSRFKIISALHAQTVSESFYQHHFDLRREKAFYNHYVSHYTGVARGLSWDLDAKDQNTKQASFAMLGPGGQFDLEQVILNDGGNYPVPPAITARIDSPGDEIRRIVDAGGNLFYFDPINMGKLDVKVRQLRDYRNERTDLQKVVWGVVGAPQQNVLALAPHQPNVYETYPFPPRAWPRALDRTWLGDWTFRMVATTPSGTRAHHHMNDPDLTWDPLHQDFEVDYGAIDYRIVDARVGTSSIESSSRSMFVNINGSRDGSYADRNNWEWLGYKYGQQTSPDWVDAAWTRGLPFYRELTAQHWNRIQHQLDYIFVTRPNFSDPSTQWFDENGNEMDVQIREHDWNVDVIRFRGVHDASGHAVFDGLGRPVLEPYTVTQQVGEVFLDRDSDGNTSFDDVEVVPVITDQPDYVSSQRGYPRPPNGHPASTLRGSDLVAEDGDAHREGAIGQMRVQMPSLERRILYRNAALALWAATACSDATGVAYDIVHEHHAGRLYVAADVDDDTVNDTDLDGDGVYDADPASLVPSGKHLLPQACNPLLTPWEELEVIQDGSPAVLADNLHLLSPTHVLALNYLAHASMMVTGYKPPFVHDQNTLEGYDDESLTQDELDPDYGVNRLALPHRATQPTWLRDADGNNLITNVRVRLDDPSADGLIDADGDGLDDDAVEIPVAADGTIALGSVATLNEDYHLTETDAFDTPTGNLVVADFTFHPFYPTASHLQQAYDEKHGQMRLKNPADPDVTLFQATRYLWNPYRLDLGHHREDDSHYITPAGDPDGFFVTTSSTSTEPAIDNHRDDEWFDRAGESNLYPGHVDGGVDTDGISHGGLPVTYPDDRAPTAYAAGIVRTGIIEDVEDNVVMDDGSTITDARDPLHAAFRSPGDVTALKQQFQVYASSDEPVTYQRQTGAPINPLPPPYADMGGFDASGSPIYLLKDDQTTPNRHWQLEVVWRRKGALRGTETSLDLRRAYPIDASDPSSTAATTVYPEYRLLEIIPFTYSDTAIANGSRDPQDPIYYREHYRDKDSDFARQAHENMLRAVMHYTSEQPYDSTVPKPANRPTFIDRSLWQLDLFDATGNAQRPAALVYQRTQQWHLLTAPPDGNDVRRVRLGAQSAWPVTIDSPADFTGLLDAGGETAQATSNRKPHAGANPPDKNSHAILPAAFPPLDGKRTYVDYGTDGTDGEEQTWVFGRPSYRHATARYSFSHHGEQRRVKDDGSFHSNTDFDPLYIQKRMNRHLNWLMGIPYNDGTIDDDDLHHTSRNPNHFTADRPFEAHHRTRQLVYWLVDWNQYEDVETAPAAPTDLSRLPVSLAEQSYDIPYEEWNRWEEEDPLPADPADRWYATSLGPDYAGVPINNKPDEVAGLENRWVRLSSDDPSHAWHNQSFFVARVFAMAGARGGLALHDPHNLLPKTGGRRRGDIFVAGVQDRSNSSTIYGSPEIEFTWVDPERTVTFHVWDKDKTVMDEYFLGRGTIQDKLARIYMPRGWGAGPLYALPLNQPESAQGLSEPGHTSYTVEKDPSDTTSTQSMTANRRLAWTTIRKNPMAILGAFGADRNGNGTLDIGPVKKNVRLRAREIARYNYYDPVLWMSFAR